ncbi:sugar phosphate isomerase/epimerase family protein [Pedobacter antarcticus]|uniref:Xylose isomerase n=2 Tax=Pedobacter antarcticus TaxID=34086 RepID=A0A081PE49_9SPHI|nr:sugar phosphate isomerase/epimerase [Pedobacter antarcticus]KEQ28972.1 xylose isomerase [Pedobacter antarcticus 4BY]SDM55608.1 Tat (twin-arginine translocation) pathway signal sequence [Pedobacter antarcticus]SFF46073.1 Tat (twin-arginine translocation) pathway signal sequence [Pedobacter antarcticus]
MNSRRTFLKQAGLVAAGALILPSYACAAPAKVVGLQLYSLREQLPADVRGVIGKVAQAGYKEVETYGYSVKDKFWGLTPKEFKALLDENGLSAPSGHYGLDNFIATGNQEDLKADIEAASAIGSEYIVVPYLGDALRGGEDQWKKTAQKLNEAAAIAKSNGIKIAYHNHDFEFAPVGNTTGYEILLKETDPEAVKFEMDIYWVVRSGNDPVKLFTDHKGRFPMWHVKDMDKADHTINTEVGSGTIDFKKLYSHANLAGLKHLIVEQENFSMDPYASIKQSADYIKKEIL